MSLCRPVRSPDRAGRRWWTGATQRHVQQELGSSRTDPLSDHWGLQVIIIITSVKARRCRGTGRLTNPEESNIPISVKTGSEGWSFLYFTSTCSPTIYSPYPCSPSFILSFMLLTSMTIASYQTTSSRVTSHNVMSHEVISDQIKSKRSKILGLICTCMSISVPWESVAR